MGEPEPGVSAARTMPANAQLAEEIERRYRISEVARARGPAVVLGAAAAWAAVATLSVLAPQAMGGVDPRAALACGAVGIAATAVTQWMLTRKGPEARGFLAAWSLEGLLHLAGIATLIAASGSAGSALWSAAMAWGLAWKPRLGRWPLGTLQALVALGGLALYFAAQAAWADTTITVVVLATVLSLVHMSSSSSDRGLRLLVERFELEHQLIAAELRRDRVRLARELHDDVCANVLALILELRRAEKHDGADALRFARLGRRAEQVLDTLRASIRWLRLEDGGATGLEEALASGPRASQFSKQ